MSAWTPAYLTGDHTQAPMSEHLRGKVPLMSSPQAGLVDRVTHPSNGKRSRQIESTRMS